MGWNRGLAAGGLLLCLMLCACGKLPEPSTARAALPETDTGEQMQSAETQTSWTDVPERPDITGQWHRTDCHSGQYGDVSISGQTAEGFSVTAECGYFSHTGSLEGTARFTVTDTAILEDYGDGYATAPVTFQWNGEQLTIRSDASGADLGFGANVTIDGTYTLGEPAYTNDGMLDRCLTADRQAALAALLGEYYEEYLAFPFTEGSVMEPYNVLLPDGAAAEVYEVLFPTMSFYGLTLVAAEDGRLYYQSESIGFYTNDPAAAEMPSWE